MQQAYNALLQDQIAEKKAAKKFERDRENKDALDREMINQTGPKQATQTTGRAGKKPDNGVLPLGGNFSSSSKPQNGGRGGQLDRQPDAQVASRNDDGYAKANPYEAQGNFPAYDDYASPYQSDKYDANPYQAESGGQGGDYAPSDEDFQRRMQEYYRDHPDHDLPKQSPGGHDYRNDNPYSYQDDASQHGREYENRPYPPQENLYSQKNGPSDYEPYQRTAEEPGRHNEPQRGGNEYGRQTPSDQSGERVQRNYLVNNPLAPELPQKRATGGFRAHQDIRHDHMGIDRQGKIPMTQGNAGDAYQMIKKKYGNHSAQYNILTGS
jgi:hypothetical protein